MTIEAQTEEAYEPPPKVRQFFMSYCTSEDRAMTAILEGAGLSWKWYYEKFTTDPESVAWFNAQREKFFGERVLNVWDAVYARACGDSTQDAKLFVERFDPKYKPETGTRHTIEVRMRTDDPETRMGRLLTALPPSQVVIAERVDGPEGKKPVAEDRP